MYKSNNLISLFSSTEKRDLVHLNHRGEYYHFRRFHISYNPETMDKQIEMQNFLFALFRAELSMAMLRALHVKPLIHYVKVPWFTLSLSLSLFPWMKIMLEVCSIYKDFKVLSVFFHFFLEVCKSTRQAKSTSCRWHFQLVHS